MSFLKEHADIEEKIKYYTEKISIFRTEFEDLVKKIFIQHFKNDRRELLKQSEIQITDFQEDATKWVIDKLLMDKEKFIDMRKRIDEKDKKFYQKYGDKLLDEVDNESKRLAENIIDLSGELEKDSIDLLGELRKAKQNYMEQHNISEHDYKEKPRPVIA